MGVAPKAGSSAKPQQPAGMDSNTFHQLALAEWQVAMEFYGKVVDENSNAIAGANVTFSWDEAPQRENHKTLAVQSDAGGLFSLHDARGGILDVRVEKQGYYTPSPGTWGFRYALEPRYFADQANPTVFQLRKKRKGEPLIEKKWPAAVGTPSPQLRGDGAPVEMDLLNGQMVTEGKGQLKLEFQRSGNANGHTNYDWRCYLTVAGGGLVETPEEFAFEAPESGYQSTIMIDMPATNDQWQGEIRRKYFIRLPDGKFGRIDFFLMVYNGVFHLHSAINPSGSRNLEPAS